jgi:hypothetical protein
MHARLLAPSGAGTSQAESHCLSAAFETGPAPRCAGLSAAPESGFLLTVEGIPNRLFSFRDVRRVVNSSI